MAYRDSSIRAKGSRWRETFIDQFQIYFHYSAMFCHPNLFSSLTFILLSYPTRFYLPSYLTFCSLSSFITLFSHVPHLPSTFTNVSKVQHDTGPPIRIRLLHRTTTDSSGISESFFLESRGECWYEFSYCIYFNQFFLNMLTMKLLINNLPSFESVEKLE